MWHLWSRLTFFHWPYEPSSLRSHVPRDLELDLFEGRAWLGLTPFVLDLRVQKLPIGLSRTPETNLRTYVRGPDGRRGVWFFSLDISKLRAVVGARASLGLPYFWSAMRVLEDGRLLYNSRRRAAFQPAGFVMAQVEPAAPLSAGDRERFLTERYSLFSKRRGRLLRLDVEHEPWPLRSARIRELDQTLTDAAGLPAPAGEPVVHYSDGVEVRVGAPAPVG